MLFKSLFHVVLRGHTVQENIYRHALTAACTLQALSVLIYSQPDVPPEEYEEAAIVVAQHGVSMGEDGWFGRPNLLGMFTLKGERNILVLVASPARIDHACHPGEALHQERHRLTIGVW